MRMLFELVKYIHIVNVSCSMAGIHSVNWLTSSGRWQYQILDTRHSISRDKSLIVH